MIESATRRSRVFTDSHGVFVVRVLFGAALPRRRGSRVEGGSQGGGGREVFVGGVKARAFLFSAVLFRFLPKTHRNRAFLSRDLLGADHFMFA